MGACSSKKDTDAADPKANKELNDPNALSDIEKADLLLKEKA